jgi:hypothetical protein
MQVIVRDYSSDAPVQDALVVVDGSMPVSTDSTGTASCNAGVNVKVYLDQMHFSVDDPHFYAMFTDPSDDREIWIDTTNSVNPPTTGTDTMTSGVGP